MHGGAERNSATIAILAAQGVRHTQVVVVIRKE